MSQWYSTYWNSFNKGYHYVVYHWKLQSLGSNFYSVVTLGKLEFEILGNENIGEKEFEKSNLKFEKTEMKSSNFKL